MEKAQVIWNQIPDWAKEKLIHNVYCTSCFDVTTIVDYKIKFAGSKDDILLSGKGKKCGHDVTRYVESE